MEPFTIAVGDDVLEDLRDRLRRTRWADAFDDPDWSDGTDPAALRALVDRWLHRYDWRAVERRLNAHPQFRADALGLRIHFVRQGPVGGVPLLLLHGWPGSFVQMLPLVDLLAQDRDPGFDVVAASLPGFGFSDRPVERSETTARMADRFHALMTGALGFERFAVHGSDFGAGVASHLADRHPDALIGVHMSGTSPRADGITAADPPDLQRYAADVAAWRAEEVGYSVQQSTRPQSLSPALSDSPAGLAAWIVEKLRRWSDPRASHPFSEDDLITAVMVYWVTNTAGSSIRLYRDDSGDPDLRHSRIPIAHLMADRDMLPTPRAWIERTARVDRFTRADRGGHFLEQEEPELVADDLRAFLTGLSPRPAG